MHAITWYVFSLWLIWQFYDTWSLAWHSVWFMYKDTSLQLIWRHPDMYGTVCVQAWLQTNKVYLPKIWEYFSEQMHQGHISVQLIIIASKQHSNAWFDDVSCRCPPSHRTILSMSGWRLLLLCPICSVSCDFYICCWQEVFCTENVCNKLPENISKWNCHSALFSSTFYRFLRSGFLLIILEPLKVRHWNVLQRLSASNSPGQTLEKYFGRFWLTWHKSQ